MPVEKVRVMISSRCKDYATADGSKFGLALLRKTLKERIETEEVFGQTLFQCFTNENEPAKAASRTLWDECLREIRRSHIVMALYNGDAGWSGEEADDGICHAELSAALYSGRDRSFVLQIPLTAKAANARDKRFRARFDKELHFTGPPTNTVDEAVALVLQTLAEALANLSRGGATLLRKESYSLGEALDWSRLAYAERKAKMEEACIAALMDRALEMSATGDGRHATLQVAGIDTLFCVHAIPAATSLAAARADGRQALLGRPSTPPRSERERAGPCNRLSSQRYREAGHGPARLSRCDRGLDQFRHLLGRSSATYPVGDVGQLPRQDHDAICRSASVRLARSLKPG